MAILASQKPKKKSGGSNGGGGSRFLVTINVLGSSGPIRFVVNEEELVATVIDMALRSHAREGRLPVLGSDLNNFLLYCANTGSEALNPWEPIGSNGGRNFVLFKKQQQTRTLVEGESPSSSAVLGRKGGGGSWKTWLNKSLSFKIPSH